MKVRFKVNAEWEEEVGNAVLTEIAEDQGIEGDEPTEEELDAALQHWIDGRKEEISDNPTGEIPDRVGIDISDEVIF